MECRILIIQCEDVFCVYSCECVAFGSSHLNTENKQLNTICANVRNCNRWSCSWFTRLCSVPLTYKSREHDLHVFFFIRSFLPFLRLGSAMSMCSCVCVSVSVSMSACKVLFRLFHVTWIAVTDSNAWIYNWKKRPRRNEKEKNAVNAWACAARTHIAPFVALSLHIWCCKVDSGGGSGGIFHQSNTHFVLFGFHSRSSYVFQELTKKME